jgi:hypothetical protein
VPGRNSRLGFAALFADMSVVKVPRADQHVVVRLPNDRELATHVRQTLGAMVWLELPAVVRPGAPLTLRWVVDGVVADASGIVCSTDRPGLAIGIHTVTETERRRGARVVPSSALMGAVRSADGALRAVCEVIDVSLGGVGLRVASADSPGLGARLTLCIGGPDIAAARPLALDVRSCRASGAHVVLGCAFVSPGLAAIVVSHLIRSGLRAL